MVIPSMRLPKNAVKKHLFEFLRVLGKLQVMGMFIESVMSC